MRRPFPPCQERELKEERDQATTLNKAHGRVEHRELTSSTMLNDHLDWPGVKQVCRLRRRTLRRGVWRSEVAYAITSVERNRAAPAALLHWWRGHWGIENKVHWVRDETFGEDRSRVRSASAAQVLAGVRNLVINWLRTRKVDNLAAALRENSWNPHPLFAMLGKQNQSAALAQPLTAGRPPRSPL
jgi:predicted transposase YbfD/YdcC